LGSSPFVCLLDSDAALEVDALAALAAPLLEDTAIGMAVPVFVDQLPEASAGPAPTVRTKVERALNVRDTYRAVADTTAPWWPVDFGIGACQLFRRTAFDAIDGIDDTYFYGPEDVDFCLRMREAGWEIVQVRGARCHHPPRRRFRKPLTRRGVQHGWAVARHLWRHRHFDGVAAR
jgi:GT2 family glycosyltransferase